MKYLLHIELGKNRRQCLCERVFKFTSNVKDITNEDGNYYFIDQQLPEPLAPEKHEREQKMHEIKKTNAELPEGKHPTPVQIRNNTLFIDNKPQRKHITPPTVTEIFTATPNTLEKWKKWRCSALPQLLKRVVY